MTRSTGIFAQSGKEAVPYNESALCIPTKSTGLTPAPLVMDLSDMSGTYYNTKDKNKCCPLTVSKCCNNNLMCTCIHLGPLPCIPAVPFRLCGGKCAGWCFNGWSNSFFYWGQVFTAVDSETMLWNWFCCPGSVLKKDVEEASECQPVLKKECK